MFLPLLVPTLLSVVACSPNNDSGVQNDAKPDAVQSSNFEAIYSGISDSVHRLNPCLQMNLKDVCPPHLVKQKPSNTSLMRLKTQVFNLETATVICKKSP